MNSSQSKYKLKKKKTVENCNEIRKWPKKEIELPFYLTPNSHRIKIRTTVMHVFIYTDKDKLIKNTSDD